MSRSRNTSPVILDTCTWIWLIDGHARIAKSKSLLTIEAAKDGRCLYLCPISMWEVATKVAKGRLGFSLPTLEWINRGKAISGILDAPFSSEIAVESAVLPGSFHGDPADRLIVATVRQMGGTLVTADTKILHYANAGFLKALQV